MNAKLLGVVAVAIVLAIAGCKNESQQATPHGAGATAAQPPTQQSTTNSGTGDPVQVEISKVQRAVKIPEVSQQQKTASVATTAALTMTTLENMTYRLVDGKSVAAVTLVGSKGQTNEEDGGEQFWLDEEHVVFGDLDGDDVDDAIVVLVSSGGGSGIFYQLVAVTQHNGMVETPAVKSLGDRIKINQINIRGGNVTVDMITHGRDDPSCCPTERQVLKLKMQGSEFVPAQ